MHALMPGVDVEPAVAFDVICAGEALWKVAEPRAHASAGVRLRPSGGAMSVALELARAGMRVGLATVVSDERFGRAAVEAIATAGVDVGGVVFAQRSSGVVLVDASGGARQTAKTVEQQEPLDVPASWSARVLVLSGLSPVIAHAAALCKAARAARRAGSLVLVDFDASLHAWAGRDPRTIRMVLREVDAARCSLADLAVLGMDVAAVRAALRPTSVAVVSDANGGAVATGPFGEVHSAAPSAVPRFAEGRGSAFTAALTASLSANESPGESLASRWHRALNAATLAARQR